MFPSPTRPKAEDATDKDVSRFAAHMSNEEVGKGRIIYNLPEFVGREQATADEIVARTRWHEIRRQAHIKPRQRPLQH